MITPMLNEIYKSPLFRAGLLYTVPKTIRFYRNNPGEQMTRARAIFNQVDQKIVSMMGASRLKFFSEVYLDQSWIAFLLLSAFLKKPVTHLNPDEACQAMIAFGCLNPIIWLVRQCLGKIQLGGAS